LVAVLTGMAVLAGWWLDVAPDARLLPGVPPMMPNTALALILTGATLALLRKEPVSRARRWLAAPAVAAVVLIGALSLAEYLLGRGLGIDALPAPGSAVGQTAPHTGLALGALGLALGLLDCRPLWGRQAAQLLAVLAVLVALLALIGYAAGVPAFYGKLTFWPSAGIGPHTAVLIALLGGGLLCARPAWGLMAVLLSPGAGGVVARRLLPAPVLVPLVLGLLSLAAQRAGAYSAELGSWLFALANITVSTLIIWWIAAALHRADSRRARAEEEVRRANQELEAANQELEAFNYSVSHDLRSPLLAADGFAYLLLQQHASALAGEAQEHLRHIQDSTRQMSRLIDDLLAFSRLGRQPLRKQAVSMADLVRACLADLAREARGRRVEVRVSDLPGCEGDPGLLKQVWSNLLSNAFKYTRRRDPAMIEVGCRPDGGGAAVYFVRDNGAGFDMAQGGQLFGAFQRLHRAEEFEGTGVGLAVVRRIVQRHGGRVWAEAEPDRGAVFFFTVGGDAAASREVVARPSANAGQPLAGAPG
jgi:signal transduction histidine kinase